MNKNYIYASGIIILILFFGFIWFFFFRSAPTSTPTPVDTLFGTSVNTTTGVTSNTSTTNGSQPVTSLGQVSTQKVFEITAGPVAGATLIQTLHPTTTLARYVSQNDGHVYDLPLDTAGAVPRIVSNVTIPGATRALWLEGGNAALLQYLDGATIKSVYLGLPAATTSTKTVPTRIKFLPDNIIDLAASPSGTSLVYMLKTSSGSDGYIANSDGTGAKKLFSLQLSQVLVSWPSPGTLLAQSKSASGVPGMVFSVDVKSGAVNSILYADGITANANSSFAYIVYQSVANNATIRSTFVRDIKNGLSATLSFSPLPEKCIWSGKNISMMYCASPLAYVPPTYLDQWHQGSAGAADALFFFNIPTGTSTIITTPGGADGGTSADILEMALSPDEHYLSYTTKGTRTLWGVRLTQ